MKIIEVNRSSGKKVKDLKPGDVFKMVGYHPVYLKLAGNNIWNTSTNVLTTDGQYQEHEVEILEAELRVRPMEEK